MNYVSSNLKAILEERFGDNPSYLREKIEILEEHTNKFDGLSFLVNADKTTKKMYTERTSLTMEEITQLSNMWCNL